MTIWFLVSNTLVNNNNIFYIAIKVNYFLCLYDNIQENEGKLKRYMTGVQEVLAELNMHAVPTPTLTQSAEVAIRFVTHRIGI